MKYTLFITFNVILIYIAYNHSENTHCLPIKQLLYLFNGGVKFSRYQLTKYRKNAQKNA